MVSPPGMEAYSATKFAVVAMSEGWALQLAPKHIGVSILCPGFVKTNIVTGRRNRAARYGVDNRPPPGPDAPVSGVLTGIPPEAVGLRVVEAIRDGDLYVFTHPEFKAATQARFDRILAAFDKSATSPAINALPPREAPGLNLPQ
jgi:NAD(P)-dependent dehydrogenase (short-subunit alcohol dehydrogenase family)